MTPNQAERLAHAVNALRPDWPVRSLLTFIQKSLSDRAHFDAAVALAWVAADPASKTPARVLEAGPWWKATVTEDGTVSTVTTRCPQHPAEKAWSCRECADQTVDAGAGLATVRAALATAPKPPAPTGPEFVAPVRDLDDVRARIDQETQA